jgi:hypothetical protein
MSSISWGRCRTDSGMSLLADDQDALNKGSARVVNAVEHCLTQSVHICEYGFEKLTFN